ncbi:MAG: thioredoxin family protein [Sulfurimonas sp.]|nr:thioredoxin family protein [Sulfurimonas sp.]
MKTIYILCITFGLLYAQTYKEFAAEYGYETDYATAYTKAKKEHKKLLLITISNYCPWCKKLENRVLRSNEVSKNVQKDFIGVILNKDIDTIEQRFITNIVPMSYIIEPQTNDILKKRAGYQKKSDFLYFIKMQKQGLGR